MRAPIAAILWTVIVAGSALLLWRHEGESVGSDTGLANHELEVRRQRAAESSADESGVSPLSLETDKRQSIEAPPAQMDPDPSEKDVDVVPIGLTLNDVGLIRENLDGLWANATREQLIEGYRSSVAVLPRGFIRGIHDEHVADGRYELLDLPLYKKGDPYTAPKVKASPLAYGLVRASTLEDGRQVKTELELSELGQHAALAVELSWFEGAIARSARKRRQERQQ